MASTRYQPGELFRKQRLQNILDSSNLGQNSQDIDGLSETAASQPDQALISLELDAPRQNTNTNSKGKRKPSDGLQQKSIKAKVAKRSPENQRKVMVWSPDRIELLLAYLKEYKSTCEFNGRNFKQDLAAMYTEIRKCLAKDYPEEFGPQVTTEPSMPIKDMDSSEYQAFKKTLDKEQELIKKGYDRMKEKIRNVRQDFRTAVNKGTRKGSSKIVQENFELLADIWGSSPTTTALPFGVDGDSAQGTEEELDSQPLLDSTDESKLHVISCFSVTFSYILGINFDLRKTYKMKIFFTFWKHKHQFKKLWVLFYLSWLNFGNKIIIYDSGIILGIKFGTVLCQTYPTLYS